MITCSLSLFLDMCLSPHVVGGDTSRCRNEIVLGNS
jgi:hypothetical protein